MKLNENEKGKEKERIGGKVRYSTTKVGSLLEVA
jgi:hypothetical protein